MTHDTDWTSISSRRYLSAIDNGVVDHLAKQALATNEPISDLVVAQGFLDRAQLEEILKPERLTADYGVENTANCTETITRHVRKLGVMSPQWPMSLTPLPE